MRFPNCFNTPFVDFNWLKDNYQFLSQKKYHIYSSFDSFVYDYTNPHTLVVDGPGIIIRFYGIDSYHKAEVHGIIKSKAAFTIHEELRELADYVLDTFGLCRLEARVPAQLKGVNRYLDKIGFYKEGTLRNYGIKDRMIFDMNVYSIITE